MQTVTTARVGLAQYVPAATQHETAEETGRRLRVYWAHLCRAKSIPRIRRPLLSHGGAHIFALDAQDRFEQFRFVFELLHATLPSPVVMTQTPQPSRGIRNFTARSLAAGHERQEQERGRTNADLQASAKCSRTFDRLQSASPRFDDA
jgi:hypothetical protein